MFADDRQPNARHVHQSNAALTATNLAVLIPTSLAVPAEFNHGEEREDRPTSRSIGTQERAGMRRDLRPPDVPVRHACFI